MNFALMHTSPDKNLVKQSCPRMHNIKYYNIVSIQIFDVKAVIVFHTLSYSLDHRKSLLVKKFLIKSLFWEQVFSCFELFLFLFDVVS